MFAEESLLYLKFARGRTKDLVTAILFLFPLEWDKSYVNHYPLIALSDLNKYRQNTGSY